MKYVIIKTTVADVERVFPFIFSEKLTHKDVARFVLRAVEAEFDWPAEEYSAGFCHIRNNEWQTEHGSESMRIVPDSRKGYRDHKILNQPNALQNMLVD